MVVTINKQSRLLSGVIILLDFVLTVWFVVPHLASSLFPWR